MLPVPNPAQAQSARSAATIASVYIIIGAVVSILLASLLAVDSFTGSALILLINPQVAILLSIFGFLPALTVLAIFFLLPTTLFQFVAASAIGAAYLVIGILSLLLTSRRIGNGLWEAARGPTTAFGVLALLFGQIVSGIFLLISHMRLGEVIERFGPIAPPPAIIVPPGSTVLQHVY